MEEQALYAIDIQRAFKRINAVEYEVRKLIGDHATRIERLENPFAKLHVAIDRVKLEDLIDQATRLDQLESANDAHQTWLADLHDTVQSISDLANRVGAIEAGLEAKGDERREGVWSRWECKCDPGMHSTWVASCPKCNAVRPRLAGES